MRPAERRKKVVEGYLVRDVDGGKPQSQFLAIRAEQIIRPDTEIKEVARSDSRRIGVVVLSAISRNAYPQRPSIRRTAHKNGLRRRGKGTAAEQTDLRLLVRRKIQGRSEVGDRACDRTAIVAPGEIHVRCDFLPLLELVLDLRRLLKFLIVIDPEHTGR